MENLDSRLNILSTELGLDVLDEFRKISRNDDMPNKKVVVTAVLSKDTPAYIIPIGDNHLGHNASDIKKFKETINFVLTHDNVYTILMGDLAETATRNSIGVGIFEENFHVEDQLDVLAALLQPLATAGKILGMVTGNHEMRITVLSGIDLSKVLAQRLNVTYCKFQGFFSVTVGEQIYDIIAWHGVGGGGGAKISKIKATEKLKDTTIADVYLSGHTHDRSYHDDFINIFEHGQVKRQHRHFVACGSYLHSIDGYAEMKGLSEMPIGGVIIKLDNKTKDVFVAY